MKNNKTIAFAFFLLVYFTACTNNSGQKEIETKSENAITALKIENLLRDSLEITGGLEVILSYLEIPKNTTLPAHFHPGEEFAYIIEGSGELTLKDKSKVAIKAGEAAKVPLKQVHSFSTFNEDAKLVVFRVHKKGEPDRIPVD